MWDEPLEGTVVWVILVGAGLFHSGLGRGRGAGAVGKGPGGFLSFAWRDDLQEE